MSQDNKADVTDFKIIYEQIENRITSTSEWENCVKMMTERLDSLGQFEEEHLYYFLNSALPRIVKTIMKQKWLEENTPRVTKFLQDIIAKAIIPFITDDSITASLDTLYPIMDNDSNYYLTTGKPENANTEGGVVVFPTTNRWASYFLMDTINFFAKLGGFDAIFKLMKKQVVGLNRLSKIVELIYTIYAAGYLVKDIANEYSGKIQDLVIPYLTNMPKEELRSTKKEDYEKIIKYLTMLLNNHLGPEPTAEIMEKLQLDVANMCFKSPFFDKRLNGLSAITDMIAMVRIQERHTTSTVTSMTNTSVTSPSSSKSDSHWLTPQLMLDWLQKNEVLEELFGNRRHTHLIKKSGDVISFLASHNRLSQDHLKVIWHCATEAHEVFTLEIMKMLGESASNLQSQHTQQLFENLKNIKPALLTNTYLTLLKDLTKGCADPDLRKQLLEYFWQLLTNLEVPVEISIMTLTHLQDIVKSDSFLFMRQIWLIKILNMLSEGVSVPFCLDLMGSILSTFPTRKSDDPEYKGSILHTINKLFDDPHNLLDVFFDDLHRLKTEALEQKQQILSSYQQVPVAIQEKSNSNNTNTNTNIKNNSLQVDLNSMVLSGRLGFLNEVQARLRFFNFILVNYDSVLSERYYGLLWDNLIEQPVTPESADECFRWLLDGRKEEQTYVSVDQGNASKLFSKRFLELETYSAVGFAAFKRYFVDANVAEKLMAWTTTAKQEFEIKSFNLLGYSHLWHLLLLPTTGPGIVAAAADFIVELTLKPHAKLIKENGLDRVREQLLSQCFSRISKLAGPASTDPWGSAAEQLARVVGVLSTYVQQCAQLSPVKTKSHGSITRGPPVTLLIESQLGPEASATAGQGSVITVESHANERLRQVKARLVRILLGTNNNSSSSSSGGNNNTIKSNKDEDHNNNTNRNDDPNSEKNPNNTNNCTEPSSTTNGLGVSVGDLLLFTKDEQQLDENATLAELRLHNNQQLFLKANQGIEKGQETVNRSRHSKTWAPKKDKAPPPNATESIKNLMEIHSISEPVAVLALKKHDWDVSAAVMSLMEPEVLNEFVQEAQRSGAQGAEGGESGQGAQAEPIGHLTEESKLLPSFAIAFDEQYSSLLFQLLKVPNPAVATRAWDLLMLIPTAHATGLKIREITGPKAEIAWDAVFDSEAHYTLLYALQIADSILFPLDDHAPDADADEDRAKWATSLLLKGGFQYLLEIFLSRRWFTARSTGESAAAVSQQGAATENTWAEPPTQQVTCLALTAKLLDFFLHIMIPALAVPMPTVTDSPHSKRLETAINTSNNEAASQNHDSNEGNPKLENASSSGANKKTLHAAVTKLAGPAVQQVRSKIDFRKVISVCVQIAQAAASIATTEPAYAEIVAYVLRTVGLSVAAAPGIYWPYLRRSPGFEGFVLQLLLARSSPAIRAEAGQAFLQLAAVPSSAMTLKEGEETKPQAEDKTVETPREFFLQFLLAKLPDAATTDSAIWSRCGQFWTLLQRVLALDLAESLPSKRDFYLQLLHTFSRMIKERPVVEKRGVGAVDEILVGLMNSVETLLQWLPEARLPLGQEQDLLDEVYTRCLFALDTGAHSDALPKCKNKTGRIAAFNLLAQLATNCQPNLTQLLGKLAENHQHGLKLTTWAYQPSEDDKSETSYVGLRNLGNTCYINSLMQQFFMIPTLRYGIYSISQVDSKTDSLVKQIQTIFGYLQESEKMAYAPQSFCEHYKDLEGNKMNIHQQQDVEEFFNLLCQRIEAQLKGTSNEKLLSSIFAGQLANEIISKEKDYPYVSETTEDYYTISIEIKGKSTLEEALDAFVKGDSLEGENAYYCEKYDRNLNSVRRSCVKTLSNTVIVHLKRFEFDYNNYRKQKVNDRCEFPTSLNFKPWTKEGLALKEGRPVNPEDTHPDSYYEYQLRGVLVHSGGADAGHYYSYIKERLPEAKNLSPTEPNWFEFNDKFTKFFDPKELPAEGFGGTQLVRHWDNWTRQYVERTYDRVRSAYMLFYDRVKPEGNLFEQTVDPKSHLGFTTERAISGIPNDIYKKIWEENATFLRDRQLFDPTYFDFMRKVHALHDFEANMTYPTSPDETLAGILAKDSVFPSIRLATQFVTDVIAHSVNSPNFKHWIRLLKQMYSKHIPACLWFIEFALSNKLIKEMTLECTQEKVRIGYTDLMVHVLRQLAPFERPFYFETVAKFTASSNKENSDNKENSNNKENNNKESKEESKESKQSKDSKSPEMRPKAYAIRFMDAYFDLLEDSRPFWRRFKQYFWVIREFATFGWQEREYWLEKGLLSEYVDYFMGKTKRGQSRRVSVMDNHNLPDLTEFISTLSWLVRGCETGAFATKGAPPTTIRDERVLKIPKKEKKIFYDKNFFMSMLEMDYNNEAAIEILTHICWEDIKKTRYILDIIMGEVGRSWSADKLPVYKTLLAALLQMKDSLQETRVMLVCTPFTSGTIKGLLAIIRAIHSQNSKLAFQLMKFTVQLLRDNELVAQFLSKHRSELSWILQFLEAKLGTDLPMDDEKEAQTQVEKLSSAKQNTYNAFKTLKAFLARNSGSKEDLYQQEREQLLQEMERLREQNQSLVKAVLYYRQNAPQVTPPPILAELEMDDPKSEAEDEDDPDFIGPHNSSNGSAHGTGTMHHSNSSHSISNSNSTNAKGSQQKDSSEEAGTEMVPLLTYPPSQGEQNAAMLATMFDIPPSAALLALKKHNYDIDAASLALTEEPFLSTVLNEDRENHKTSTLATSTSPPTTPKDPSLASSNDSIHIHPNSDEDKN